MLKKDPENKYENAIMSFLKKRPYKVSKKKPNKSEASFEFKRSQFSFQIFKTKEELVFFNVKTGVFIIIGLMERTFLKVRWRGLF